MGRARSPNPCVVLGARVPLTLDAQIRIMASEKGMGVSQLVSILISKGYKAEEGPRQESVNNR